MVTILLSLLSLLLGFVACQTRPNIVFFLTDDQDFTLGGLTPMTNLQLLVANYGASFSNAMVSTPICCPSRSSFLSGRYIHNGGALNNSLAGNCANSVWINGNEKDTFAIYAKKAGYVTQYSGKYLNDYASPNSYPNCTKANEPGCAHIPPGWDKWLGLFGNSKYYNYSVSVNGVEVKHADNYYADYFPDLVGNNTVNFIKSIPTLYPKQPFLAVAAFPSPHAPATCAPQYCNSYLGEIAPRTLNWNVASPDKHWLMTKQSAYTPNKQGLYPCDTSLQHRWQTLLTVDDYVKAVITALEDIGALNNTYFFYTADHGFNLGTFRFGDKRLPYENDLRIPLLVRGPGIARAITLTENVLNIDLAPTFVELMGLTPPSEMDGKSYASVLLGKQVGPFRTDFLVDYHGEYQPSCGLESCPPPTNPDAWHEGDSKNNTYQCLRSFDVSPGGNTTIYCEFDDDVKFVEFYDLTTDPWQLTNAAGSLDPALKTSLHNRLAELKACSGPTCRQSGFNPFVSPL